MKDPNLEAGASRVITASDVTAWLGCTWGMERSTISALRQLCRQAWESQAYFLQALSSNSYPLTPLKSYWDPQSTRFLTIWFMVSQRVQWLPPLPGNYDRHLPCEVRFFKCRLKYCSSFKIKCVLVWGRAAVRYLLYTVNICCSRWLINKLFCPMERQLRNRQAIQAEIQWREGQSQETQAYYPRSKKMPEDQ